MAKMRRGSRVSLLIGGLGFAFLAGLATGKVTTFSSMKRILEAQVQGNLNFAVEELLFIRYGETEKAIELLELQLESAMGALPQARPWSKLSPSVKASLLVAKKYRERYPPAEMSPELREVLSFVPDERLDPSSCRPAVRRLLTGVERQ